MLLLQKKFPHFKKTVPSQHRRKGCNGLLFANWLKGDSLGIAYLLRSKKCGSQARQLLEPYKSCIVQNPHFGHNYACCLMLIGKKFEAIQMIRLAVENGYVKTEEMENDPSGSSRFIQFFIQIFCPFERL